MTKQEIADILDGIAAAAAGAAGPLAATGPVGPIIAGVVAVALKAAATFERAGKDSVAEILRLHSKDPMLQTVRSDWEKFVQDNFPPRSEPPPAPDDTLKNAGTDDPYPEPNKE